MKHLAFYIELASIYFFFNTSYSMKNILLPPAIEPGSLGLETNSATELLYVAKKNGMLESKVDQH